LFEIKNSKITVKLTYFKQTDKQQTLVYNIRKYVRHIINKAYHRIKLELK